MSYDVLTISVFERQAKKLAKKYPSLKTDLSQLISLLNETPKTGTLIAQNCYKIRMAIKSIKVKANPVEHGSSPL